MEAMISFSFFHFLLFPKVSLIQTNFQCWNAEGKSIREADKDVTININSPELLAFTASE